MRMQERLSLVLSERPLIRNPRGFWKGRNFIKKCATDCEKLLIGRGNSECLLPRGNTFNPNMWQLFSSIHEVPSPLPLLQNSTAIAPIWTSNSCPPIWTSIHFDLLIHTSLLIGHLFGNYTGTNQIIGYSKCVHWIMSNWLHYTCEPLSWAAEFDAQGTLQNE